MNLLGELEHGDSFALERDPSITGTVDRSLEPPHGGFVYATINGESKYLSKQTHVMTTNQPSPLQTALQAAIIGNGLAKKPTIMETVWRCVKDMQPCSYVDITKRTGIPQNSVSTTLSQLEKRNMIYSRGAKGNGFTGTRKEYFTDLAEYKRQKLPKMPLPDKQTARPIVAKKVIHLTKPTPVQTVQDVTQSNVLSLNVDSLTIAQARELWVILNKMFGAK